MGQNRTIPYGYCINKGKIEIHTEESKVIKKIFQKYANGTSYLKIANSLTAKGIGYTEDKPIWNKNMIARILQNTHYKGSDKYPSIVEKGLFESAVKAQKNYTLTESKEVKKIKESLVCGVCGESICRKMKASGTERWRCVADCSHISVVLNDKLLIKDLTEILSTQSDHFTSAKGEADTTLQIVKLQNEIQQILQNDKPSKEDMEGKVRQLASLRYSALTTSHVDMETIQTKVKQFQKNKDIIAMMEVIDRVKIIHSQIREIHFKNGITYEKGEENNE